MQSQQSHPGQAGQSLAQPGQALEIAGHIELVSRQASGLIQYITGPSGGTVACPVRCTVMRGDVAG